MDHLVTYDTPEPLDVELKWSVGDVALDAQEGCRETRVELDGPQELIDQAVIELRGSKLIINEGKRKGFRLAFSSLDVRVTVPAASSLSFETGSSDLEAEGRWERVSGRSGSGEVRLATVTWANVTCGSGGITIDRVADDAELRTGSGDIEIEEVGGRLRAGTGSGDVRIPGGVRGQASITAGSGDVEVGPIDGGAKVQTSSGEIRLERVQEGLAARTASGDVDVEETFGPVQVTTASGDVRLDRVNLTDNVACRTASGSVDVGIPHGVKVWADVNSMTGDVYADLERQGEAGEGEPYLTLRVTTVSGDVNLQQV